MESDKPKAANTTQPTYSPPGARARPIQRCQELRQEEPERDKSGAVRDALDMPLSTLLEQASEVQRQVMPGGMRRDSQISDHDRRIQQEQAHENRQAQSNRTVHRALLPDQKDYRQCQ